MISYLIRNSFVVLLVLILSCGRQGQSQSDLFEQAENRGKVSLDLEEASGLVASIANPGNLWTLNDSGNPAEVFLVNDKAYIVLRCKLKKGNNRDWEDIAIGPGPIKGINYLYVGEIGDNEARYQLKYLFRFPEPTAQSDKKTVIEQFDTLIIRLPDGARDMESMAMDQTTGDIYLISKREKNVNVYKLPFEAQVKLDTLVPEKIATLPYHNVVAADFSFEGKEFLLKTYDRIYYWHIPDSLSIQQTLMSKPTELSYKPEPQGESIAWTLDGTGFYTLSESVDNERAKLYFYKRAK